jgi:hypothetical protein
MASELCVPKPSATSEALTTDQPGVPDAPPGAPEPSVFGRASERDCAHEAKRFAKRISKLFASEIASDPRGFKKQLTQTIKRNLPPFPGRPTEQSITLAAKLKAGDTGWRDIYPVVIPDHAQMDPPTRRVAESNLRSAIRSRRNARRRRNTARTLIAQTTPVSNVPLSPTPSTAVVLGRGKASEDTHPRTTPVAQG